MHKICLFAVCLMVAKLYAVGAFAQNDIDFYGGSKTGTYKYISEDIKHLLAEKKISLEVHTTDGSVDNIKNIATSKTPAIGIVQSDVLSFMRRSENPDTKRLSERLRMMMPLYQEEVHILTNKSIKRFSDLAGKRVVIGEEGSGNMLTAVNLLALADIRIGETIRLSPPKGVRAVLEGSADAVIYVGGKPVKLFKNIENLETADGKKFSHLLDYVHFIPVASPKILAEYKSASITPEDYRFVEQTIPTIAVQAILVTGNYVAKEQKAACKMIQKTSTLIRNNLGQLKKTGHPKWRDIKSARPISLWEKDKCSWPKINPKQGA